MSREAEEVLEFWFADATDDAARAAARNAVWFGVDAKFDRQIAAKFSPLVERALRGELDSWRGEPRTALALLILLDQFPRNLYRGSERAFAGDARAVEVALEAIERGYDRQLHPLEAAFLYLPLEHSEDLVHQDRCVVLYESLAQRCNRDIQAIMADYAEYARSHRELIRRFGRFPHRNRVLGRTSTEAEREHLAAGAESFGQGE